jgi:hypothetical protein
MGFKDLSSFNVVMLGSLVERLFKARYFTHIDSFGSKIGTNMSYVWLSIFSTKNVVQQGARWCIGTSKRVPLMEHPWILNGECITTSQMGNAQFRSICVQKLIDHTMKTWKEQLVHYLFDPPTTLSILNTSFSSSHNICVSFERREEWQVLCL